MSQCNLPPNFKSDLVMDSLLNPCGEIPLGTWEQCIARISEEDIVAHRIRIDEFNSFVSSFRIKKKKNWRSIDDEWTPTKTEW